MKMKTLLFFFLFFSLITHAQDSSFQLKDYKYRTDGYRALTLNANLSGGTYYNKIDSANNKKSNSISLNGSHIYYYRIVNTDKRQHTSSIGLSPYFYSSRYEEQGVRTKDKNSQIYFYWNRNERFYGKNKWFFELGNNLSSRYYKSESKQKTVIGNAAEFYVDDELSIGVGKGRIEYVKDAQMALFIINDLKTQGLITGDVEAATIYQFAQLITDLNNKRIFDNRKRRIYELTQINNFLKEKGIVNETDIRHFTTINDNWTLALNPFRSSGSAWFVRAKPKAGYSQTKRLYENGNTEEFIHRQAGVAFEAGYENYKPINLKWQRDYGVKLVYDMVKQNEDGKGIMNGTPVSGKTEFDKKTTFINSFYGIGFYPNNRTRFNADLNVQAGLGRIESLYNQKTKYLSSSFNLSTDYFVSYRTRLNVYVSCKLFDEHQRSPANNLDLLQKYTYFGLSLVHAFL